MSVSCQAPAWMVSTSPSPALPTRTRQTAWARFAPLSHDLRQQLLDLCSPGSDELYLAGIAGNAWARLAASGVNQLLQQHQVSCEQVSAIGSHGRP
ncbi:anhydro-N-acetylmuramic acid kinase [Halopseudomonas pachastrellae]|nr:anhydro-N-acetylmuramic acid kinase [Halopseudomonas pachastrellae]